MKGVSQAPKSRLLARSNWNKCQRPYWNVSPAVIENANADVENAKKDWIDVLGKGKEFAGMHVLAVKKLTKVEEEKRGKKKKKAAGQPVNIGAPVMSVCTLKALTVWHVSRARKELNK